MLLCSRHGCKNRSKSSKTVFCMDPTNFRFKIHEISAIGAKCYLNVARSAPDMKIMEFCKVLLDRAQNIPKRDFHHLSTVDGIVTHVCICLPSSGRFPQGGFGCGCLESGSDCARSPSCERSNPACEPKVHVAHSFSIDRYAKSISDSTAPAPLTRMAARKALHSSGL